MRAQRRLAKQSNQKNNIISIGERRRGLTGLYRSADERRAEGRALRDAVPRESHGHWKAPSDRRDPVELLVESNKDRMPQLIPIRHGRMVQSPFAFYRGSAALMAADLARTPATGLRVQACGDAHLLNCVEQRIGKVSARTVVEHDFPKLVEQQGSTPMTKQPRSRLSKKFC
jgi:Uncharacterized protein conserved in bacteria (DUF2252)